MIEQVSNYSAWQLEEGRRRREILERFFFLRRQGFSRAEAVEEVDVPDTTLRGWLDLYERNHDWLDLFPLKSTGRLSAKAKLEAKLGVEPVAKVIAKAKACNLQTGTNSGSWRFTTATGDDIPEEVRAVILDPSKASKHHIPKSLLDATKVTRVQRLAFRGRRDLSLNGSFTPRFVDVMPGDIFVSDDYTPTWGWWVPWPKSKAYPFGCKLLQGQLIALVDYASLYRPAYALIAREHSSYRAADIWAFYGDVFRSVGLPRIGLQHEGNIWQANTLRGVEIEYAADEIDRERRVGALSMLPSNLLPYHHEMARGKVLSKRLEIFRSVLPKSKPVELALSMASKFDGTLFGHMGNDQRLRPNRDALKRFAACKRGAEDPRLHFLSCMDIMEKIARIYAYLHEDAMEGDTRRGKPADLWNGTLDQHPLLPLPEDQNFLLSPDWVVRTVKGAYLDLSYTDRDTRERHRLYYQNGEALANLDGEQVLVYHDRANPEIPASVVNLKGRFLCSAQPFTPTGAFLHRNTEGFGIQAEYERTVMRATRIIAAHASSRQLPPEIAARRKEDRMARIAEVRTPFSPPQSVDRSTPAAPTPAPAPVTAPTPRRPRMTPAELLEYQPQVQPQPEPEAAPEPTPEPTPARSTYRVIPWHQRVHDDEGADPVEHFHPPRGGVEKTTPLGATQAGSVETQN